MSLAARLVASIIVASALIALVAPGLCIGTGGEGIRADHAVGNRRSHAIHV